MIKKFYAIILSIAIFMGSINLVYAADALSDYTKDVAVTSVTLYHKSALVSIKAKTQTMCSDTVTVIAENEDGQILGQSAYSFTSADGKVRISFSEVLQPEERVSVYVKLSDGQMSETLTATKGKCKSDWNTRNLDCFELNTKGFQGYSRAFDVSYSEYALEAGYAIITVSGNTYKTDISTDGTFSYVFDTTYAIGLEGEYNIYCVAGCKIGSGKVAVKSIGDAPFSLNDFTENALQAGDTKVELCAKLSEDLDLYLPYTWHVTVNGTEYTCATQRETSAEITVPVLQQGDKLEAWITDEYGNASNTVKYQISGNDGNTDTQARTTSKKSFTLKVNKSVSISEYVTGSLKNVKWSSSNQKIAKVSSKGKVTALYLGTVTITAKFTDTNQELSWKVVVNKETTTELRAGDTDKLSNWTKYVGAKASSWKSNKKSVAYISGSKIVAKKKGTAVIYCKYRGTTYKLTVKVKAKQKSAASTTGLKSLSDLDKFMKKKFEDRESTLIKEAGAKVKVTRGSAVREYGVVWYPYYVTVTYHPGTIYEEIKKEVWYARIVDGEASYMQVL